MTPEYVIILISNEYAKVIGCNIITQSLIEFSFGIKKNE
jgi:hypothetical protein